MIVDKESFTDIAVHLKLASDAVLAMARTLGSLAGTPGQDEQWDRIIGNLMAINNEITFLERILRALYDANKDPLDITDH